MIIIDGDVCKELNSDARVIAEKDGSTSEFSCGNDKIDEYFHKQAATDTECVTYIFPDDETNEVIAFLSIRCSGIIVDSQTRLEILPAVEIKYFAVAEKFQHIHMDLYETESATHNISDEIFAMSVRKIRDITDLIGADYIILYSVPTAVSFYERNLFQPFSKYFTPERTRFTEGCTPMYMPL